MKDLYTIEEAAKALNIKETTLRNWIYNGKIKGVKHGYARFISKAEVEEILKSKEENK